jgi:hypothetical protein
MKTRRAKTIRLILIGSACVGSLTGCSPDGPAPVTSDAVYTNNYYLPGVGYYHAPFNAWYPYPYNHYDPALGRYYFGGRWSAVPNISIVNLSSPSPETAGAVQAQRLDIPRGGFGGTGGHYGYFGGG